MTPTAAEPGSRFGFFALESYMIRRKVLKLFGGSFHVYDGDRIVGFSEQKAFKLKEDIRVFTDESKLQELLTIQARQVIDFSASYDVIDPVAGVKVGSARRKGFKSMFRDSWELMDAEDQPIGKLQEDSLGMAVVRRFVSNLVPQRFSLEASGGSPVIFKQRFNPIVYKLDVMIPHSCELDRRLIFALAVLICAIEGRQS